MSRHVLGKQLKEDDWKTFERLQRESTQGRATFRDGEEKQPEYRRLEELKNFTDYWISLDAERAAAITGTHGNLWCSTTANVERGNWVRLEFDLPTYDGNVAVIPTSLRRKHPLVVRDPQWSSEFHDRQCLYRRRHLNGELQKFSAFGEKSI
jgi:hypothetical protein